jgi:hypothetical protein
MLSSTFTGTNVRIRQPALPIQRIGPQCLVATHIFLVATALLLWPRPAVADYGANAIDLLARHSQHNLGFSTAPVLQRQTSTRIGTLRTLGPILDAMVASVTGNTQSMPSPLYQPDAVVAERARLLSQSSTTSSGDFRLESQTEGLHIIESKNSTTVLRDGIFTAMVHADGAAFHLTNHLANHDTGTIGARLTERDAEQLGRSAIRDMKLIPDTDIGQLIFLKTRYAHFTGNVSSPGDRIVGTTAYFGRQIGGVPVVGPSGSRISIEFTANHGIRRIAVDWSPVALGNDQQTTVDRKTFLDRLTGKFSADQIDSQIARRAYSITRKVCGYIDFGTRSDQSNSIQLGCQVNYMVDGDDMQHIAVIPLANRVIDEPGWVTASVVSAWEKLAHEQQVTVLISDLTNMSIASNNEVSQ